MGYGTHTRRPRGARTRTSPPGALVLAPRGVCPAYVTPSSLASPSLAPPALPSPSLLSSDTNGTPPLAVSTTSPCFCCQNVCGEQKPTVQVK